MIRNISAVIIIKDGEKTIKRTLQSLTKFENVVVYDNGSSDNTIEIVKSFSNVNLVNGSFSGFGPTKNRASSYALHDWIFSLDSDEVVSNELLKEIQALNLKDNIVYKLLRVNFYKKQKITHCWGKDNLVRIYNRMQTQFNNNNVHEEVLTNNLTVQTLSGNLLHFPYSSISSFIQKFDQYSDEFAGQYAGKKKSSPSLALFNSFYCFFKTYFLKRAFLDGYPGLVIAFSHAATNFYKYIKLYEANQSLKEK